MEKLARFVAEEEITKKVKEFAKICEEYFGGKIKREGRLRERYVCYLPSEADVLLIHRREFGNSSWVGFFVDYEGEGRKVGANIDFSDLIDIEVKGKDAFATAQTKRDIFDIAEAQIVKKTDKIEMVIDRGVVTGRTKVMFRIE